MDLNLQHFNKLQLKKDKPYLILGKGPTFAAAMKGLVDLSKYYVIGLNHVGLFVACDYIHFIDIEVFKHYETTPERKFIVPAYPHVANKVSYWKFNKFRFSSATEKTEFYWYNCSTNKRAAIKPIEPFVTTKLFSAESVFQLLAYIGVTKIHTLGIDGGTQYHTVFNELALKPLTNGQPNFDRGVYRLNQICQKRKLEWIKL